MRFVLREFGCLRYLTWMNWSKLGLLFGVLFDLIV